MKEVIDLTNLGDEFVLHFGGEFHRINADTFANSLLEFSAALKEINRIANPDCEIEFYIEALGEGSFRAKIKAYGVKFMSPLGVVTLAVISVILSTVVDFTLEKHFGKGEANVNVNVIVNDGSHVIEIGDKTIVLPKDAGELRQKIAENPEVEKRISETFKVLEKDSKITSFGITEKIEDKKPLIEFAQGDFLYMSKVREFISSEENHRQKEEDANLVIVRAIFEKGSRKWEFARYGHKISAPILDKSFQKRLLNREYIIGSGDTLKVRLRINQYRDEKSDVWLNKNYEILEVKDHVSAPRQQNLFEKGRNE